MKNDQNYLKRIVCTCCVLAPITLSISTALAADVDCLAPPPMPENAMKNQGAMPPGPPPMGKMKKGGMPCPPGGGHQQSQYTLSGTLTANHGQQTVANRTIRAKQQDQSAVYAHDTAQLELDNVQIETSGNTSSFDNSSFHGLNAGILAAKGASVAMKKGSIKTTGSGANGAFAVGKESTVALDGVSITATGGNAHGIMVAGGGMAHVVNSTMVTSGRSSAAIATDRGSGTIDVIGGTYNTSGPASPILYSTGIITVKDIEGQASASEAIVVEGSNTVKVTDSNMRATQNGVMLYQSFSGDAHGQESHLVMTGGKLSVEHGSTFYVTNTTADIKLNHVDLTNITDVLVKASADRWGRHGQNGGHVTVEASSQKLAGLVTADDLSEIGMTLKNGSAFTGATRGDVSLSLDKKSKWVVTDDSFLTKLTLSGDLGTVIADNGHTITYDPSKNPWAEGKTIMLHDGGKLIPKS